MSETTQWTIIRAAADGSASARTEFAKRYESVIRAYLGARWRGSALRGEIDDATQEVFLDCFRPDGPLSRVRDDRPGGFRAFLYGVVRNTARNAERKRATARERQAGERGLDAFEADDDPLSKVFDRAWASSLLQRAADLQLERARAEGARALKRHRLLALRHGDSLPIREIAGQWDMPATVLHQEYRKAREEFRAALKDVVREEMGGGPESLEVECARLLELFS